MRILIVALLALISQIGFSQNWGGWNTVEEEDTTEKYTLKSNQLQQEDTTEKSTLNSNQLQQEELEYPDGANLYFAPVHTSNFGFDLRASFLKGTGRVKTGFSFGTTLLHFTDTLKDANGKIINPSRQINSLGFGFAARVYGRETYNFFFGEANYIIGFNDSRFGVTNGLSLKVGGGTLLNDIFYFEGGFIGQVFQTITAERPASFGLVIGFGILF